MLPARRGRTVVAGSFGIWVGPGTAEAGRDRARQSSAAVPEEGTVWYTWLALPFFPCTPAELNSPFAPFLPSHPPLSPPPVWTGKKYMIYPVSRAAAFV